MKQIEGAVLLDLDGTLVDSHKIIVSSFRGTLDHFSIPWTTEAIEATIGKALTACYQELTGQDDAKRFCLKHDEVQSDLLPTVEPFPGVVETLEKIRASGIRVAIVTARTKGTRIMIDAIRIKNLVESLVTGNDVASHKPDPEGINMALAELGIRPQNAIMVGDTPPDIGAGKNARVLTVGVAYGSWGEKIVESDPDYVIGSFGELREILARKFA